ncbi:MAG: VanW family protein [Kouleothrix sp.]|nr:VanW family protein [Kouleothrix sp.]
MRFYAFVSLLLIAFTLDVALLVLGLRSPGARLFQPAAALAAARPSPTPTARPLAPSASATPSPSPTPQPTPTISPSPSPTATASPTPPPTATATPAPRLIAGKSVSFTPDDRAVRANIRLALALYDGALTHVILAPGEVFSFNAALGRRPQRLPWKDVLVKPTAAPPAPEGAPPATPAAEAQPQRVQGGGLCDLASRYVMAARPLLPARAFQFVNHVRSNGIHLSGVPTRDSVSIWAIGGGKGEQDLTIANTTDGWVEWIVERHGEKITVTARLWDRSPLGS